jgi:hypothetical protein
VTKVLYPDTVNITRLPFDTADAMSVAVSQLLWPVTNTAEGPKVVILAAAEEFAYSFAAASLVHDPIMGDLLISPADSLPDIVRDEIRRLDPSGSEGVPPVVLVGPFTPRVVAAVKDLGYETLQISGRNPYATAASVARFRLEVPPISPDGPVSLFLVSGENPADALGVPYYAAHAGVPVLFTRRRRLPEATARLLEEMNDKYLYIVGSRHTISDTVIDEVKQIMRRPVRRISGDNPFIVAVNFARYYDPKTQLGWNRNQPGRGDAFTFTNVESWDLAAAGANLAHAGKHTPLLAVEDRDVPPVVHDYLEFLRPPQQEPPMPPFMHGYVLGSDAVIDRCVQAELDLVMRPKH